MKYQFVIEEDPDLFQREVDRMLENGWKPQGGLTIQTYPLSRRNGGGVATIYAQAFVKHSEP